MKIITIVKGKIKQDKVKIFEESYARLKSTELPEGLINSILLKNKDETKYTILSSWDSYNSIEKMRAVGKPKAIELFENVGAIPTIEIYEEINEIN